MSTYYLILAAVLVVTTDGQLYNVQVVCRFSKNDLSDFEIIVDFLFNKGKFLDFRYPPGGFNGYTQYGRKIANLWNAGIFSEKPLYLEGECVDYASLFYKLRLSDITVEPSVHLRSVTTPPSSKHTTMLKCSAYRFYPEKIWVTWTRNGKNVTSDNVTSDMVSTEELYEGDFHFQHHSYLEYTPTPGEEVSCMVEHASLPRPKILHWDPSMPVSERVQLGIGALGVFLGLVVLTAGSLYYKRRPIVVVETPSTVELRSTQEPNLNVIETLSQEACM